MSAHTSPTVSPAPTPSAPTPADIDGLVRSLAAFTTRADGRIERITGVLERMVYKEVTDALAAPSADTTYRELQRSGIVSIYLGMDCEVRTDLRMLDADLILPDYHYIDYSNGCKDPLEKAVKLFNDRHEEHSLTIVLSCEEEHEKAFVAQVGSCDACSCRSGGCFYYHVNYQVA